ncbi:hypothetical protein [Lapidilactobacillus bayanensis]|uniref:hypothetical protein n=1 Tax=Lapidilactobacillus bayanensis TaxID=2485998 RepID=UPI000F79A423|nr:hypothetical protein [Lapidilactobacillus bayanensis]
MTIAEYNLRMEAYKLKEAEDRENIALQAWYNQQVQATVGKKNPKPKYKTFTEFYDIDEYKNQIRTAFEADFEPDRLGKHEAVRKQTEIFNKRMEEFKKLKAAGKIIPLSERR